MVPPWGPGVLAQERPKFFSFQTLPGDWGWAGGGGSLQILLLAYCSLFGSSFPSANNPWVPPVSGPVQCGMVITPPIPP